MALILSGLTKCPLCDQVLAEHDEIFATTAFEIPKQDSLSAFQDAGMHQNCFMAWKLRPDFLIAFNNYFENHYRGMRFMNDDGTVVEREPKSGANPAEFE